MLRKVEEFIKKNSMISSGDNIVVGVSGGADSVCLLDILYRLSVKLDFSLTAVHVNHMIRGEEAVRDEEFVKKICEQYQVPLKCVHKDVVKLAKESGMSLEEAGRMARYEAFGTVCGGNKIAVAHHGDDQTETVLHNIIRGSSMKGAGGIRPVRDNVIRPLLCVSRLEIEAYLRKQGLDFCTDSTNLDEEYTRNKLRNVIIPFLKEHINPNLSENVNDFAADLRENYEYIHARAGEVWKECHGKGDVVSLRAERLLCEPAVIRREVIVIAINAVTGTKKNITRKHIDAVEQLLHKEVSKQVHLPYGIIASRGYEELILQKDDDVNKENIPYGECKKEDFDIQILEKTEDFVWEKLANDCTKVFDYDRIKGNLELRKRMPGDFIILDSTGKKKLLKAYFIDEKVPKAVRDKIWLLADGSHVLWIVGYRISAEYKVGNETKRLLKVTIRRNEDGV